MKSLTIYDPSQDDKLGSLRGAGRVASMIKENLGDDARIVADLDKVDASDMLLIPLWQPFQKPLLSKRITSNQIIMIYDAIPLKYPEHFPIGLKGRWWLFKNLRALGFYDKVITISEHAKRDIAEYMEIDPKIIKVVHPTTSRIYFKPVPKPRTKIKLQKKYGIPDGKYCMYVGDTNWNKNLLNLAHAVVRSGVSCVFVGKTFSVVQDLRGKDRDEQYDFLSESPLLNHPEQRTFKEFVKLALHDDKHFIFPGFVEDKDLVMMYRNAVCNVLISHDEGFGLSFLEAATQKCPSVLADTEIFKETAGKSAVLVDQTDPKAISDAISKFFQVDQFRAKYSKAAHNRSKMFAPAEYKKKMLKALQ